jgi:hypothetical protein
MWVYLHLSRILPHSTFCYCQHLNIINILHYLKCLKIYLFTLRFDPDISTPPLEIYNSLHRCFFASTFLHHTTSWPIQTWFLLLQTSLY